MVLDRYSISKFNHIDKRGILAKLVAGESLVNPCSLSGLPLHRQFVGSAIVVKQADRSII